MMIERHVALSLLLGATLATRAAAQRPTPAIPAVASPNDSACTYRSCAFGISPRWDGLAVVRGAEARRVANLHFFWPRDITGELRGADSAAVGVDSLVFHAQRAVALRRAGAGFTDLGVLTLAVAVARSLRDGHVGHRDEVLAGAALGAIVVSVPLQFAADGELSRAVWWHNIRFAR
jgi:hypothetical protein